MSQIGIIERIRLAYRKCQAEQLLQQQSHTIVRQLQKEIDSGEHEYLQVVYAIQSLLTSVVSNRMFGLRVSLTTMMFQLCSCLDSYIKPIMERFMNGDVAEYLSGVAANTAEQCQDGLLSNVLNLLRILVTCSMRYQTITEYRFRFGQRLVTSLLRLDFNAMTPSNLLSDHILLLEYIITSGHTSEQTICNEAQAVILQYIADSRINMVNPARLMRSLRKLLTLPSFSLSRQMIDRYGVVTFVHKSLGCSTSREHKLATIELVKELIVISDYCRQTLLANGVVWFIIKTEFVSSADAVTDFLCALAPHLNDEFRRELFLFFMQVLFRRYDLGVEAIRCSLRLIDLLRPQCLVEVLQAGMLDHLNNFVCSQPDHRRTKWSIQLVRAVLVRSHKEMPAVFACVASKMASLDLMQHAQTRQIQTYSVMMLIKAAGK